MKTVSVVFLASAMLASLTASAAIVFNDQFNTAGDLSKWTVIEGTPIVEDGVLKMNPPASGNYATTISTTATWTTAGTYELDFTGFPNITSDGSRLMSQITMPGGLTLAWWDYNNGLEVWYNGTNISGLIGGGAYSYNSMTPYKVVQNGRSVQVYMGAVSIATATPTFSTTVASDPNFITNGGIAIFDKYMGTYAEYDSISLSYSVPEPAMIGLLGAGLLGYIGRRKRA